MSLNEVPRTNKPMMVGDYPAGKEKGGDSSTLIEVLRRQIQDCPDLQEALSERLGLSREELLKANPLELANGGDGFVNQWIAEVSERINGDQWYREAAVAQMMAETKNALGKTGIETKE